VTQCLCVARLSTLLLTTTRRRLLVLILPSQLLLPLLLLLSPLLPLTAVDPAVVGLTPPWVNSRWQLPK
jgi:hypothetical protein